MYKIMRSSQTDLLFNTIECNKKLPFSAIFLLLALFFCIKPSGAASVDVQESTNLSQGHIALVGRFVHSKSFYLFSSYTGVVERIYVSSGQKIARGRPLSLVRPIDSSFNSLELKNESNFSRVSEIFVKEGDKIETMEPIMRLTNFDDIVIESHALEPHFAHLQVGKDVAILVKYANKELQFSGEISAIHEVSDQKLAMLKVEVQFSKELCVPEIDCPSILRAGTLAKLILAKSGF